MKLARILDPANVLSLVRVPLAALVWLRPESPVYLLSLVALAAISDGLDGWLGRKTHANLRGTENVGAWLDPLCDKIFMVSAALAVASAYDASLLVVGLLLLRDISIALLVVVFRLAAGRTGFASHDFRATRSGKITTAMQTIALAALVLAPAWALPSAIAAATFGVIAVIDRVELALKDRVLQRA